MTNDLDKFYIAELALNIRRNLIHMHQDLEVGNDRDSRLIDYLNHIDTIVQEIETVIK